MSLNSITRFCALQFSTDSLFSRTSFISLLISYNQFQSENFKQGFNSLYCHAPAFLNISKPLIRQSRLLSQFVSWHPYFFSFCQYSICYFFIQFHATNVRKLFHISKLFVIFLFCFWVFENLPYLFGYFLCGFTGAEVVASIICCCQYDKDTKMKANHNVNGRLPRMKLLLPVRQRYKNESKSQLIVD